ncbi:Uncharacterized membrane protein [Variovorax sp. HW608]|uniref:DUF1345 domain-containing protein n=1 Tax=Variovorax sp. HW608 TaxID=1034889 RepID=UPI00081FD612|nr:DUF1345 domain-containing protein [Variovorax sp. HW608]SCK59910.1 Uncharacterized membrane protein [Variovorax sp. HW608]
MRTRFVMMAGWQRLLCGGVAGLAVGLGLRFLPWRLDGIACGLIGWCVGAAVYLLPAWRLAEISNAQGTRHRAQALDQPRASILAVMLTAVGVSAIVIAMLLQRVPHLCGAQRVGHIALGLLALACSWLLIHTIYAFHYAHRYYQAECGEQGHQGHQGHLAGLDFPGKAEPDYFDFLYYSFVVGMTSQVSDVQVRSREMRRLTLVHGVLAFAFNMLVLALSINVVAATMQDSSPPGGSCTASSAAAQLDQARR